MLPALWYLLSYLGQQRYNAIVVRFASGVILVLGGYWLWQRALGV